jgi:DNA-binding response OmpR family regulator
MPARVLVATDDPTLALTLATALELREHRVDLVTTEPGVLASTGARPPVSVAVLDLLVPALGGPRLVQRFREQGSEVPALVIVGPGEEPRQLPGLRTGIDDVVAKPVALLELLARVDGLLRRADGARGPVGTDMPGWTVYRFGDVEVDPTTREVRRRGQPVALTPLELDLLLALLRRRGAAAQRRELLHEVWGYRSSVVSRTVDTHVARLRDKLEEDPARPRHILTVRKTGYRFQP